MPEYNFQYFFNLPVITSIEQLSAFINIDSNRLKILTFKSEWFYNRYAIPKKNGSLRDIYQPSKELKIIQIWILRNILEKLSPSKEATAFIRGKSLLNNVIPHAVNRYFLLVDIEDFFPSITFHRVYEIFSSVGYSKKVSYILTKLCTCNNVLPQGGVTSPYLSNLVSANLDRRLSGLALKKGFVYTRYADDMIFSSNNRAALNRSMQIVLKIIESENFLPNLEKLKLMGPKIQCRVTGLIKNSSNNGFGIGKKKKRLMRSIIYNAVSKSSFQNKYYSLSSIMGWVSYIKSVDMKSYLQIKNYWDRINNNIALRKQSF